MRCCLQAQLHSGIGNWLYVSVESALVAAARNCSLALPNVLHDWFRLPPRVRRPGPGCRSIRSMQEASASAATRRRAVAAMGASSFDAARARLFRELFANPRAAPRAAFKTSVHLRTVADVGCRTYANIRACRRVCLRDAALRCVVRNSWPPVLVLSDSAAASARLVRMFAKAGVRDVSDESAIVDARNHSGHSRAAARRALLLWSAFGDADRRFASGMSTFSKSALLARGPGADFVLDPRCSKAHASDGALFSCRPASLSRDLV